MTTATGPNILDPALIADPYGGYGALREEAPVLRGQAPDGSPAWYVTRQDEVRAVLSDPRFVNDPDSVPGETTDVRRRLMASIGLSDELTGYITDSILDRDGAEHTRLRKLVSRAFTVRRVAELRPRVEAIAADLLDRLPERADLMAGYAYPLPITVICELVGVGEGDRHRWREWATQLFSMDRKNFPTAIRDMVAHCKDLIAARRADPRDDLLTGLIQAREDDGDQLSETEMVTMVLTLVLAGHETTAHLVGNGVQALLTHPDQLRLLRERPELWPGAVHELMRWTGPVLVTRIRYAREDVELGGARIAAGDAVQTILVSANRDPRAYDDPDRFDVTRRPAGRGEGHVGFGHGAHYCLGAALARQEGEIALRALFDRFPDLALDSAEPEWEPMPSMRRLARLPVRH
ncbi:cytochrome P450 family protein [Pseudonocardia humida]|uniref:Cytochrome P450 n=1 Tax=Pseudonocardia humida TaxID=2800819 RepID=A0ABT1A571_9PSEU|nr:cytochrome P450 [Pseudonocardia humida]MCO1658172.1 cytochrome P450 [Pseudonocardia humida]